MADKPVDELEDDIDTPELASDGDLDIDVDPKAEDLLTVVEEEGESWSDDPVRMYLTQMGEIPLLTRQEEIALAKRIEMTRARFRSRLLGMRLRHSAGGQGAASAFTAANCRSTARCKSR